VEGGFSKEEKLNILKSCLSDEKNASNDPRLTSLT
tara:strand:- start:240 stop:344 length:105 start_codon:yes stop_codon:yes gene_type:complete